MHLFTFVSIKNFLEYIYKKRMLQSGERPCLPVQAEVCGYTKETVMIINYL